LASPTKFWSLFLNKYRGVANLEPGNCTEPLDLHEVAVSLGLDYNRVKAPSFVSITTLGKLPSPLRSWELYVVRLGQRVTGYASFTVCRASSGFREEVFHYSILEESGEEVRADQFVKKVLKMLSGEAVASAVALGVIAGAGGVKIAIPRYQVGNAVFEFKPSTVSKTYTYYGQVEVDAIAVTGSGEVFAIEAKKVEGRGDGVFKYQLLYSMKALADKLEQSVRGVLAVYNPYTSTVAIAFTEPPANTGEAPVATALKVSRVIRVVL